MPESLQSSGRRVQVDNTPTCLPVVSAEREGETLVAAGVDSGTLGTLRAGGVRVPVKPSKRTAARDSSCPDPEAVHTMQCMQRLHA